MVFAEACQGSHFVKGQVFGTVFLDIAADVDKLGSVFLLLTVGRIGFDYLKILF